MSDKDPIETEDPDKKKNWLSYSKLFVCMALFIYVAYHLGHALGGALGNATN
ncbi:hypothetical protein [Fretibacter rubidus]|uniref:hypothetical protein n=1 Tax=Fretibacter rubidus TaxID=570162 RepID=UPI00352A28C9